MTIYILYYVFIIGLYFLITTFDFYWHGRIEKKSVCSGIVKTGRYRYTDEDKWRHDMKWFVILATLVLAVIMGLRADHMGIDLLNSTNHGYLMSFEEISEMSWKEVITMPPYYNYEKGYVLFNRLVGGIWNNRHFFLFICALACYVPVAMNIYRYSRQPLLSVIIYLGLSSFILSFSGLRQAIAIGITMYALDMVRRKKLIPFLLLVLIATSFHSSAFLFVVVYPIYHIKLSKHASVVGLLLLPVLYLIRVPLFTILTTIAYGQPYIEESDAGGLFIVYTIIYFFAHAYGDRENEATNGLMNMFWIACAIQSMSSVYPTVTRMGYYYEMALVWLLPEVYCDMKVSSPKWQRNLVMFAIGISFLLFGIMQFRYTSWAFSYPYVPFWEYVPGYVPSLV